MELTPAEIQMLKDADWENKTIQVGSEPIYKYDYVCTKDPPKYKYCKYYDNNCIRTEQIKAAFAGATLGLTILLGLGPDWSDDYSTCIRTKKVKLPDTYSKEMKKTFVIQMAIYVTLHGNPVLSQNDGGKEK